VDIKVSKTSEDEATRIISDFYSNGLPKFPRDLKQSIAEALDKAYDKGFEDAKLELAVDILKSFGPPPTI